jgi:hypothetical protein
MNHGASEPARIEEAQRQEDGHQHQAVEIEEPRGF